MIQIPGSYHQKSIEVYSYSPQQQTNVVTIICKGLFGVFDPGHVSGVNMLGSMLTERNSSHVVFYNSSRDFTFSSENDFTSRRSAFAGKTFSDELSDLHTVIRYVIEHSRDIFDVSSTKLVLRIHGSSIGGTLALMATATFPQIQKLSLCAPPSQRGSSKKPIVSTMPEQKEILLAAEKFTGSMLLLYGGDDMVVPKESSLAIATHAAKAQVTIRIVPKADHSFKKIDTIETSDAHKIFADIIFDFLSD